MSYKIKKLKIYPPGQISWSNGVYLGMSMNNKMFQSEQCVHEMIKLISAHVSSYKVLVGDYLHRYNEQIFNGLNEVEAINKAKQKGQELTSLFSSISEEYKKSVTYDFLYSEQFVKKAVFKKKRQRFNELYNTHHQFQSLINYTVDVFLRRQDNLKISLRKAKELCRNYLLEELVIFEMLAEEGLRVNIYPGNQLPIIKEIATGTLINVSKSLETISAVEIKFRPL